MGGEIAFELILLLRVSVYFAGWCYQFSVKYRLQGKNMPGFYKKLVFQVA